MRASASPVGLCMHCVNHRVVESSKGSVFHLCTLSERDARFAKYPRLPVWQCAGFTPDAEADGAPPPPLD